jgi:hypothetical protein
LAISVQFKDWFDLLDFRSPLGKIVAWQKPFVSVAPQSVADKFRSAFWRVDPNYPNDLAKKRYGIGGIMSLE